MNLLEKYIAKTVLGAIALVTLMLAGLQIFILLVNQLDDLGKGNFGIGEAAIYVLLQTPYQVYLFFPMASLLGCLTGLGIMANHRELLVMRAAGMSIGQVIIAVLKAALLLIVLVTITGETLVPELARYANDRRTMAMSRGQALRTAHGVWVRQGNDFVNIAQVQPGNRLIMVNQFHFDDAHALLFARNIREVHRQDNGWQAIGISETRFGKEGTSVVQKPSDKWDVLLDAKVLGLSGTEPDEMSLIGLRNYVRIQQANHQNAHRYELAFWQRIGEPFTTVVMMLLAIPFVFGPLRQSSMGSKFLAGASVGFGFHLMNRFFGAVSQVFQWPAELVAFGPTCFFALLGLYLMRRVR